MSRRVTLLFAALVAAQVVGLMVFAGVRQTALLQGREVTLQTVPVDPRSLLQGDYAILDYEIAELPDYLRNLPEGAVVYVLLEPDGAIWHAVDYWHEVRPPGDEVYVRGQVNEWGRLDLGIGTYFVPEGTGHIIEGAQDVKVVVAVGERGQAVIKQVLVDGAPFDPIMP